MRIKKLSAKQREVFRFVTSDDTVLICDGAVRSGKTTVMAAAFIMWAMEHHNHTNFGICGKTVQSAERNVLRPLQEMEDLPYTLQYKIGTHMLTVKCGKKENYFFLFGGKDESSYTLIQGITLAGVLFDEVALMPRSFVEQAVARAIACTNPKYFFNCNPESPNHYFYKEWIKEQKPGTKHLHFLLEDNPLLTPEMIQRTKSLYSGVFYDRYIRGLWVLAEGLIYPMYANTVPTEERAYSRYVISMDYGILNATAMGLWGLHNGVWYMLREYYHSGRETSQQKTDEEYYAELEKLAGALPIDCVIVDPSAASFIELVRRKRRFKVRKAVNEVVEGISKTASCLQSGKIMFNDCCKRTIEEFGAYRWDADSNTDKPIKENDHSMDQVRYLVNTLRLAEEKKQFQSIWTMG